MLPFVEIGEIKISTYVLTWGILFGVAFFWVEMIFRKLGLRKSHARWSMLVTMVAGVLGAKLYGIIKFVIIRPDESFLVTLMESGFGSYGLIVFGLGAAILVMKILNLPVISVLDAAVPLMILAIALGRTACFLSGDGCYGPPTDAPWGISFPHGVEPTLEKVHPTPLYEVFAMVPLGFLFWKSVLTRNKPGSRFTLFLLAVSGVRFMSEFYRSTQYPRIVGMTVEQAIALVFIACAALILLHTRNKPSFSPGEREALTQGR